MDTGVTDMSSSEYEYRRGEPFLEKAVDILHVICSNMSYFAAFYQGGRWGKARLRKLLHELDCYESIRATGDSLELVRYLFLKNPFEFSEPTRDHMIDWLFVKGRWKNPAYTEEERAVMAERRLKYLESFEK